MKWTWVSTPAEVIYFFNENPEYKLASITHDGNRYVIFYTE